MLPTWLREKLASPPTAGAGIHAWLFSCARQLHAHLPADAVATALAAATASAERPVPAREIRDAVHNSKMVPWTPRGRSRAPITVAAVYDRRTAAAPCDHRSIAAPCDRRPAAASDHRFSPPHRWPRPNALARRARLRDAAIDGITSIADLWERSPVRPSDSMTADDWLDLLFPSADWLCLALDHPATARSRRREKWSFGPADACSLVVPSPMTAPSGRGLDGRTSHRCLDNTAPRRWLVIEFDHWEGAPMDLDEQAALHWSLGTAAQIPSLRWPPLTLCVHSGGKSLHGWYGPVTDEQRAHDLMSYAVSLGADPATWNRCQLVRLPGGRRKDANSSREVSPQREAPAAGQTSNIQLPTSNLEGLPHHGLPPLQAIGSWMLEVGCSMFSPAQRPLAAVAPSLPPKASPAPIRQQVFYFAPHPCHLSTSSTSSSEPGAPPASTPALVPTAPG